MEAKEYLPRAPSKKADWVKAGNKKSACFSAKIGGAHQGILLPQKSSMFSITALGGFGKIEG